MANSAKGSGMSDDDRALLARMAAGDQQALCTLAARHQAALWRFVARQLGGDAALVEDTLQEVWLAAWRSAGRFRGEGSPLAWLFQIARYLAINARKAQARHPTTPFGADDAEATTPSVPDIEATVLDRLELAEAFQRLSLLHQEVLELVAFHGFSLEETARIVGVPVGTAKSRMSYARRALAAALAKGSLP
jgi:RNA polymerase sigma-70 factor (ECF subfamily)